MPPEMGVGLYKAVSARASERLSDGRLDSDYVSADQGRSAISNASSHEQVFAEILGYPLSGFFQWEVMPLCDWQQPSKPQSACATTCQVRVEGGSTYQHREILPMWPVLTSVRTGLSALRFVGNPTNRNRLESGIDKM